MTYCFSAYLPKHLFTEFISLRHFKEIIHLVTHNSVHIFVNPFELVISNSFFLSRMTIIEVILFQQYKQRNNIIHTFETPTKVN